jgi:hypothetical protein
MRSYPLFNRAITKNLFGRDYIVGDIHGNYLVLMSALKNIGFDFAKDRLFAVGDLINKGPDSYRCMMLLSEKWFYSVAGNHEMMLIDLPYSPSIKETVYEVGGSWLKKYSENEIAQFSEYLRGNLSLSISLESNFGRVGIVHAACPSDWSLMELELVSKNLEDNFWGNCLWNFDQGRSAELGIGELVKNVDYVISGHISSEGPVMAFNHLWIDTYHKSRSLIIISIDDIYTLPVSP